MRRRRTITVIITLQTHLLWLIVLQSTSAWPDVEVESREYKAMLDALHFHEIPPCQSSSPKIDSLIPPLRALATSVSAKPSGSFSLKDGMPRIVEYYDTPGDCLLQNNHWILRRRQKHPQSTWQGTLKTRHGDRYHSTFRRKKMNECCADCVDGGGKFEEDINLLWHSVFSYSHKCDMNESSPMTKFRDISDYWIEMKEVFADLNWSLDTPLQKVGDLTVTECVYEGFTIDFDEGGKQEVGDFSLTLWYDSPHAPSPSVAELSFTIKSVGNKLEDWNKATIMRAHDFWDQVERYVMNDVRMRIVS